MKRGVRFPRSARGVFYPLGLSSHAFAIYTQRVSSCVIAVACLSANSMSYHLEPLGLYCAFRPGGPNDGGFGIAL